MRNYLQVSVPLLLPPSSRGNDLQTHQQRILTFPSPRSSLDLVLDLVLVSNGEITVSPSLPSLQTICTCMGREPGWNPEKSVPPSAQTIHSGFPCLFFTIFSNEVHTQLLLLTYGGDPVANYWVPSGSNASEIGWYQIYKDHRVLRESLGMT